MKDLDTLGVLGTQKTVFFQEPPQALQNQIADASKKIERLQEQLNDANEILMMPDNIKYHDEVVEMLNNYIKRWGIK